MVDDCSTDGTRARLEEITRQSLDHGVRVLFHEKNRGNGAALRNGFASAVCTRLRISYSGRTYEEGKKIGWKNGVRTLWCVVKHNLLH